MVGDDGSHGEGWFLQLVEWWYLGEERTYVDVVEVIFL